MPPPKTFVRSQNQTSWIPCSSHHSPPSHQSPPNESCIHLSHDSPNSSLNIFPTLIHTFKSIRYLKNQFLFPLNPFPFKNPIQFHSHFQSISVSFNSNPNYFKINLLWNPILKKLFLLLHDSISHVFKFHLNTKSILASLTQKTIWPISYFYELLIH